MGILDGILDGLGWIWDNTVGAATDAIWNQVVGGLVSWVVDAIAWFVAALLRFFERSSTPKLTASWFSGDGTIGGTSPYGVIAGLAASVLLICVLASLLQGLLAGEGPAIAGRLARDVPLAILGIVATIGVTQVLLGATDELAHAMLRDTQAGANATRVLETLAKPAVFSAQASFVVFLLGLVAVIGAFLLWVELLIRASLIYLLVALSPLAYAAFVWPAARRMLKRLLELTIALVCSKLVIAIALAIAASALSKGPSSTGIAGGEEQIGTLLVGVIMFALATFAPFLILKLLPVVEAAVVAQGISRAPLRSAQSATATSFYVARLAGGPAGAASLGARAPGSPAGSGSGTGAGPAAGRGSVGAGLAAGASADPSSSTAPRSSPSGPTSTRPGVAPRRESSSGALDLAEPDPTREDPR